MRPVLNGISKPVFSDKRFLIELSFFLNFFENCFYWNLQSNLEKEFFYDVQIVLKNDFKVFSRIFCALKSFNKFWKHWRDNILTKAIFEEISNYFLFQRVVYIEKNIYVSIWSISASQKLLK